MNEFNRAAEEYRRGPEEAVSYGENPQPASERDFPEQWEAEEFPKGRPQRRKRANGTVSPAVVAVVAAAVLVMAAAGGLIPPGADASIVSAESTDTDISFDVDVEKTGVELSAVVYNDFTSRTFPLAEGSNSLTAGDLTPGMRYTVAVVMPSALGDITLDRRPVSTGVSPPVTEWLGIEHECTCNVDGYFHFTMLFLDGNGWWSGFRATLTDADGRVSECVFTDDIQGEQKIDVAIRAGLLGKTATFTVTCDTSEPSAPQKELVLYTAEVKI